MKNILLGLGVLSVSLLGAESDFYKNGDLGLKIGTLGIGVEYSMPYSDTLAFRVGANKYTYGMDSTESNVDYSIDLDLQSFSFLADYSPFHGGFVVTGGLLYNQNELSFNGKPTGGNYDINGVNYSSTDIGSLNGLMDFNDIAPYVGIGYRSAFTKSGNWRFNLELGALYQGNPNARLTATCGAALTTVQCNSLKSNVAAEQKQLEDEISGFDWYPVASIGVSYKF